MHRIEKGIEVLEWAIKNKCSLTSALQNFQLSEPYLRSIRKKDKSHRLFQKFSDLYEEAIRAAYNKPPDDLIDRKTVIKKGSITFDKDKGILDATGRNHVSTLEMLIKEAKIDQRLWSIDRHVVNKWDVTTKEGKTYQNWQIKAWLNKRIEVEQAIDFESMYKDMLSSHKPIKYAPHKYVKKKENNLLEINIFDLHLGKLCWGEEVNNNYDTKIAIKRFKYALETLVGRAGGYDFERIVFPVGNDFFNSDGHLNTTTLGTMQDDDSRWQKTFRTGWKLLVWGIDFLSQYAPVDVLVIPANHDFTKSFFLGETLSAWYRNSKDVNINNGPNPRKYYEYGNTLIGYTHGDKEKPEALRSLMAHEAKDAWARTAYKEFHLGHQHRKIAFNQVVKSSLTHEELGMVVRYMSSLAGTDAWHHSMGFLGPVRAAEGFLWNKESGLVGNFNANIKLNDDL